MRARFLLFVAAGSMLAFASAAPATESQTSPTMAVVGGGQYQPPTPIEAPVVTVAPFRLDRELVTNAEFLSFVGAHPEWRRDRVARVFADEGYLARWKSPADLGAATEAEQPVVEVSWFSARAFCAERGARLATIAEWEVAAAASDTRADGASDPSWQKHLLAIYSAPAPSRLPRVGGQPNFWGIRDMHAVVWEWVLDFSSTAPVDCGSTARAGDGAADFPAFERAAMRTAIHAETTTPNLGFRCARDIPIRGDK